MTDLDILTATTQIEVALRDTIALALRRRYPPEPSVSALRARQTLGSSGTTLLDETNVELVPVAALAPALYRWNATSRAPDDGAEVIAPADRVAARIPGRWLKASAPVDGGFLDAVRLYEGEDTEEMILEKVLGAIPSCVVVWRGEDHQLRSVQPGALYEFPVDFEIWVSSKSIRRGNEALLGSSISDEAATDPGVFNAVGRVKRVLAGSNLGLGDGVDFVQLGAHTPKLQSLSEGQFVHALKVRVKASLHIPDAPGEDLPLDGGAPAGLFLQPQLVEPPADGEFDFDNSRMRGLDLALGAGLQKPINAGWVRIAGAMIQFRGAAHTFPPWSLTYRDLRFDGTMVFASVRAGDADPAIAAGAVRIAVTETNQTAVVTDQFLIGAALSIGEPDVIPKP